MMGARSKFAVFGQLAQTAVRAVSNVASLPAPVKGWNARDSVANMDPMDAVQLTNFFPSTTTVNLRYGYTQYATGLPGQVETVMAYAGAAMNKLKAVSGAAVYDTTSAGAVGAAEITGLGNSRFQYVNFATTAGNYLCMVNGSTVYRVYDGTAWHKDGDGPPYDITAATSSTLVDIHVFKSRLWFIQTNTLKAWYLPINSIGGAATMFDLSGVFQQGGYLQSLATWTLDAGYGVDDYLVFTTTKGEVAVYRLTDPATPAGTALIGIWSIGSPIGRRSMIKYKGDNLIICQDGVFPMAGALQSSRLDPQVSITDRIQSAMSQAITSYGANFGWQLLQFSKENMLILNVPVQEGLSQQQFIMNTITGAWCNFTGWAANCWEIYQDSAYFGGNTYVGLAWNGNSDNGTAIQGNALQAFNAFRSPGLKKRYTRIRPFLYTNGTPTIYANLNINFDVSDPTTPLTFVATPYGVWDTAVWDSALWGSDLVVSQQWQGANGVGEWAGPRLKVASNGIQVNWAATDIVYERAPSPTA